jgi:hypothetical protein
MWRRRAPSWAIACTLVASACRDGSPGGSANAQPVETSARPRAGGSASAGVDAAISPPARPELPPPTRVDYDDLRDRLKKDVADLPAARNPGSAGWSKAQHACEERLRAAGFEVSLDAFEGGTNVVGKRRGERAPREIVVVSAHYDHFASCPGADDDGSGIAAVLEAARALGAERGARSLVIACFDREEDGLVGSRAYASHVGDSGDRVTLAVSLDAVGYADARPGSQQVPDGIGSVAPELVKKLEARGRRADFIAAVGDSDASAFVDLFDRAAERHGVGSISIALSTISRLMVADVNRSDHASFWLSGYPAMLVTDTADFRNPRYHCQGGVDSPESLDYAFLARVTATVTDLVRAARG